jgi:CubicO group peptidase (beta-lactamase class C family)
MRLLRRLCVSVCAVAALTAPALAQEGGSSKEMEAALAAGFKAGFTCSNHFIARVTENDMERNDFSGIYKDYQREFTRLPAAKIDEGKKLVSVTYAANMPPRLAAYRPGMGCTTLPIGADESALGFLPRFAGWSVPAGEDRGSAIGSNVKIELRTEEAARLELPVELAFDEQTYGNGTKTSAVVIVRDGQIVAEKYARGIGHETPQRTWSAAKSITATIIGAARKAGYVDLDHPAVLADWNKGADPRRAITLRNLLQMASGLDSGIDGSRTDRVYFGGVSVVDAATTRALEVRPGTRFKYANDDTLIAMRSLREAMKSDDQFHRFAYEKVLHKIGATHTTMEVDWNGDFVSSSQVWATARDLARIGQLYVQNGIWGGERVLPADWAEFVRTKGPAQPAEGAGYGAQFWLMDNVAGIPEGTFYMAGNRGQYVVIVPSMNAVVVRRGFDTIGGERFDIDRFAKDTLLALQAASDERNAEIAARDAEDAAIEAEIAALITSERARSDRHREAIRVKVMTKYGRM